MFHRFWDEISQHDFCKWFKTTNQKKQTNQTKNACFFFVVFSGVFRPTAPTGRKLFVDLKFFTKNYFMDTQNSYMFIFTCNDYFSDETVWAFFGLHHVMFFKTCHVWQRIEGSISELGFGVNVLGSCVPSLGLLPCCLRHQQKNNQQQQQQQQQYIGLWGTWLLFLLNSE